MISPIEMSLLERNLVQLTSALYAPEASMDHLPLVAPTKDSLYYTQPWWIGRWIGMYVKFSQSQSQQANYVKSAIFYTLEDLFDRYVRKAFQDYEQYTEHLATLVKQDQNQEIETTSLLNEKQCMSIRHTIVNCDRYTFKFWRLFVYPNGRYSDQYQANWIKPFLSPEAMKTALFQSSLYKHLKKASALIDLEGILEQSIPLVTLARLEALDPLLEANQRELKVFIKALNNKKNEVKLQRLERAFKEIVCLINLSSLYPTTIQKFVFNLQNRQLKIFAEEDPKHIQWRSHLKPRIHYHQWILGPQLSPNKLLKDHFRIFALTGYENQVFKVGRHRLDLDLESYKVTNWAVISATIFKIVKVKHQASYQEFEKTGCYALVEKLHFTLDRYEWLSSSFMLDPAEFSRAMAIASHLDWMRRACVTPIHFDYKQLGFNLDGELRTLRPLEPGPFNYSILEAFCYDLAKGNRCITDFLMHVSKLVSHAHAQVYREAVLHSLKTGKTDFFLRQIPPTIEKNVCQLCHQAIQLREECMETITALLIEKGEHSYKQNEILKERIIQELTRFYQASSTPGMLPPSFQKDLIDRFVNKKIMRDSTEDKKVLNYYQEAIDYLIELNKRPNSTTLLI
jgi:hypothetical protein